MGEIRNELKRAVLLFAVFAVILGNHLSPSDN